MKTNRKQPRRDFIADLRKKLKISTLEEIKQREVKKAIQRTNGDKALAGALLGIGKTTVYRTLERAS
jgi:transcriptional regulator of acetoin/glycerol metabolism